MSSTGTTMYKDEVLGRRCSVVFFTDKQRKHGKPFWGKIVEYSAALEDASVVRLHRIVYDDGDEEWHDLALEEREHRLAWPKGENANNADKNKNNESIMRAANTVKSEDQPTEAEANGATVKREANAVKQEVISSSSDDEYHDAAETEKELDSKPASRTRTTPPRPDGVLSSSSSAHSDARIVSPNHHSVVARTPPSPPAAVVAHCAAHDTHMPNNYPIAAAAEVTSPDRKRPATTKPSTRRRLIPPANEATKAKKAKHGDYYAHPNWVEDMDHWMQNTPHGHTHKVVSVTNANSVMRQVKKWVRGEGIGYKLWPDHVEFKILNFSLQSTNFGNLVDEARKYEEKYGEDKGHGWLLRHPLRKLQLYQAYCREHGKF